MGNILLVAVDNAVYPTTVEPLHTVFSKYGTVEKIAVFEKNNTPQALIQYADRTAAMTARSALQGHAVYEGGYNMVITGAHRPAPHPHNAAAHHESNHADLSIHSNTDTSWDYTGGKAGGGAAARHDWPRDRGGEPQNVTGIDYEQAHEAVIKAVQQVMSGQAARRAQGSPWARWGPAARYGARDGNAAGDGDAGRGHGGMPGYPQMPQMPGQPGMGLPPHMQPRMH
eukprot:jgi/Tetstr1/428296/TSEL_001829.t1